MTRKGFYLGKMQLTYTKFLMETIILTGAVAIIAAAVYFFLVPSHTSVSSISGLGIVLSNFIPLPLSAITMILNVVLLIIGFITCGKGIWRKNRLHQHYTSSVPRTVLKKSFRILAP